jgi:hypothetical protein
VITTLKIPPSQAFKYYYVDIYEVSYVEQKLKERQRLMMMSRVGLRVGRRSRERFSAMV